MKKLFNNPPNPLSGFTLLEMLIALAIFGVLSFFGIGYLGLWEKDLSLETQSEQIVRYLRQVQSQSISREKNRSWGIHFKNNETERDFFEIYSTTDTYSSGATTSEEIIYLDLGIEFSDPGSGVAKDVQFSKKDGMIPSEKTIILFSKKESNNRTITINKEGRISLE